MYRLEYNEKAQRQGQSLVLNALLACPRLERLVLINGFIPNDQFEILYQFAKNMEHLIAFCFVMFAPKYNTIDRMTVQDASLFIPRHVANASAATDGSRRDRCCRLVHHQRHRASEHDMLHLF